MKKVLILVIIAMAFLMNIRPVKGETEARRLRIRTSTPTLTQTKTASPTLQYSLTPTQTRLPYLSYALSFVPLYSMNDVTSPLLEIIPRGQEVFPLQYNPGDLLAYMKYNCQDKYGGWHYYFGYAQLDQFSPQPWNSATIEPTPTIERGQTHCYSQ